MLLFSSVYFLILDIPLLQPEMIWLLAGERMADDHHMYKDIIDDTGPLASGVYWLLHVLFGRNVFAFKIFSAFVILFQVAYINSLFIRYKSFEDNTYIPAMVMIVLFHFSFDLMTLSPALMGSTFIVLALGQLFSQTVLQKEGTDSVLLMGVFGGIAACFHFPLITFLPFLLFTGIVVSGISFSQFLLCFVGYFLPLVFCGMYYYWIDGLQEFIYQYIFASRISETYSHVNYRDMMLLLITPLLFGAMGYFLGNIFKTLTVNQQKQSQLMVILIIFAFLSLFLTNRKTPYQMIVMIPPLTYFISQLFISIKKGYLLTALSIGFIAGIPIIGYVWTYIKLDSGNITEYAVMPDRKHQLVKGKEILVLGNDLGYYLDAKLTTPYLNYHLTKTILEKQEDFVTQAQAFQNFNRNKPAYVVDENGLFSNLLAKMPLLARQYEQKEPTVYIRK